MSETILIRGHNICLALNLNRLTETILIKGPLEIRKRIIINIKTHPYLKL